MTRLRLRALTMIIALVLPGPALPSHGAWFRHTIDRSSAGADGVRLADINGDGFPDVATGWEVKRRGAIWYESPARSPSKQSVPK